VNNKLRILLTVPHLHSTQSPYREMIAIVRYLPKDEFDLTICALRQTPNEDTVAILNSYGIPWMIAAFRPKGKTIKKFVQSFRSQKIIDGYGRFDIQHSLDFTSSPFEAYMAHRKGRRYVFSQRSLNEGGNDIAIRFKALLADGIVAISDHTMNFMRNHNASSSKLKLIYNGIDLMEFSMIEASSEELPFRRFIISVGHLERRKRHEDAIKAFSIIAPKDTGLHLCIAGGIHDQKYFEELQQLTQSLNMKERVHFLGARKDVVRLMKRANVLVLCSESEGGSPTWVLLEAMAVGLPFVASNIYGSNDAVLNGKAGIIVPVGDVNAYAEAFSLLLSDPDIRVRFTENSNKLLREKFSAQEMVNQLADFYRKLMNRETSVEKNTYEKISLT
jgi:glycosyltransferase involved in cell wall biosynthesis